jgi:hypothetical protein
MKTKPLTFLLALTFLFLFSGSVFADDLKDAMAAHKSKDYKEAVRLYRLSAKQGNAEALKWYRLSENKVMQRHSSGIVFQKTR